MFFTYILEYNFSFPDYEFFCIIWVLILRIASVFCFQTFSKLSCLTILSHLFSLIYANLLKISLYTFLCLVHCMLYIFLIRYLHLLKHIRDSHLFKIWNVLAPPSWQSVTQNQHYLLLLRFNIILWSFCPVKLLCFLEISCLFLREIKTLNKIMPSNIYSAIY